MLSAPDNRWVAVARHVDLTIVIAARDVPPSSLRLEPAADPVRKLLGPEPPGPEPPELPEPPDA